MRIYSLRRIEPWVNWISFFIWNHKKIQSIWKFDFSVKLCEIRKKHYDTKLFTTKRSIHVYILIIICESIGFMWKLTYGIFIKLQEINFSCIFVIVDSQPSKNLKVYRKSEISAKWISTHKEHLNEMIYGFSCNCRPHKN